MPSVADQPDFTLKLAEITEAAAAIILPYWRSGLVAESKADDSPVTQADREAEVLILERLTALWPDIPTVAEEASALHGLPEQTADRFFLIDPLDGTRGFVRGSEAFTVNIGLIENRRPVAGAITAPATGVSWRGGPDGAWTKAAGETDWRRIQVRPRPARAHAVLSHTMGDRGLAKLKARHPFEDWSAVASSLKFCLVAQGDYDLYPRTGPTSEWDTAAGQAILEAAGGRVTTPEGEPFLYDKPGFRNGDFVAYGGEIA